MVVVDASAFAAIAFGEPQVLAIKDRLRGHTLIAPGIFPFELANIARTKTLQRPSESVGIAESLRDALAFGVSLQPVNVLAVLALALDTGLTAYDASYLRLARDRGVALVTLDKKLAAHAEKL